MKRPVEATAAERIPKSLAKRAEARSSLRRPSTVPAVLSVVTCPSCWHRFDPGSVCFIAEHASLIGDPILGPFEALRFHPTRLDGRGRARDPEEALCTRLACPRCHVELPRAVLELQPLAISAIGAPASGKSHLLVASMWTLRQLAATGGPGFDDADPTLNATLHVQESALFLDTGSAAVATLPKTEIAESRLSRDVFVAGQVETLPIPLLFTIGPVGCPDLAETCAMRSARGDGDGDGRRPRRERRERRLLVLQDNAGEHFLPGRDRTARDATGHLAQSDALLIVLDPLQDRRFVDAAGFAVPAADGHAALRIAERQELVIAEAATRIRRLAGLPSAAPIERPVVVAMTKADLWAHLIPQVDLTTPPIRALERDGIDEAALDAADAACASALERFCPEILAVIRGAFAAPRFVPVSALGRAPTWIDRDGEVTLGIPAGEVRPRWSEVPLLLLIHRAAQGERRGRVGDSVGFRARSTATPRSGAEREGAAGRGEAKTPATGAAS